jgi:hypothetical protein
MASQSLFDQRLGADQCLRAYVRESQRADTAPNRSPISSRVFRSLVDIVGQPEFNLRVSNTDLTAIREVAMRELTGLEVQLVSGAGDNPVDQTTGPYNPNPQPAPGQNPEPGDPFGRPTPFPSQLPGL